MRKALSFIAAPLPTLAVDLRATAFLRAGFERGEAIPKSTPHDLPKIGCNAKAQILTNKKQNSF